MWGYQPSDLMPLKLTQEKKKHNWQQVKDEVNEFLQCSEKLEP